VYTRAKALRVTPSEYTGHVVTMEDIIERKRAKAELTQAQEVALESASLRNSAQTPYDVILMDCHMPRNRR
jgi:CheY-like chemotaxis protein